MKVSYHPAKFGGHRHCDKGDITLVVEEKNSTCCGLNLPLMCITKAHELKAHGISS